MQPVPDDINTYLRLYAAELEGRVLSQFPPIHRPEDGDWGSLTQLRRKPYPAQALAIMAIAKRWDLARSAAVVAECGTGKTLVSLGAVHAHARGRRYTAVAMVPPMLTNKWCREILITLPGVRVFLIDGLRNGVSSNGHTGLNEVRLRNGHIVREGLHTTLSDLRLQKHASSARARWDDLCRASSIFVVSRERAKLGYFWRHSFLTPRRSGPYLGCVVNPDTGRPILTDTDQLRRSDFRKAKLSEVIFPEEGVLNGRRPLFSPLWQADGSKVRRYAPVDFLSRYLSDGFFDYAIADEVHELKGGETAQGNALGALARCAEHIAILTGTLLGGYADELFHILFRLDAKKMVADGFEHGETGLRRFSETYGVLEKVTVIEPQDNACSEARISKRIRRRPGASPLLFGRYLMEMSAFLSLEDISSALPSYTEEVIGVDMDPVLRSAYDALERDIKQALQDHPGNPSVISAGLNALLLYPDRPFGLGNLIGYEFDEAIGRREPFVISSPADLDQQVAYAKERRLLDEIRAELACGRKVQVYAVYTRTRDVTRRLQRLLMTEGIRAEVLTAEVPPEQRESWYERHLKAGMQVCICHPKLVQTGLDYVEYEAATPDALSKPVSSSRTRGCPRVRERHQQRAGGVPVREAGFPIGAGRHRADRKLSSITSNRARLSPGVRRNGLNDSTMPLFALTTDQSCSFATLQTMIRVAQPEAPEIDLRTAARWFASRSQMRIFFGGSAHELQCLCSAVALESCVTELSFRRPL